MLTRFVRIQLIVFTIVSVIGVSVMIFGYLQAPTVLGIGRINVTVNLPATGGLYRFSNVTYRGVEVGKVTSVDLTDAGARATLVLDSSPRIPADLRAEVRSISAVGEQYVDLLPHGDSGPYLTDGSTIERDRTSIPQPVGPMLDQVSNLVASLPKERLSDLLDESYRGFNGSAYDFGSLLDSTASISKDLSGVARESKNLVDDSRPLLNSQAATADSIRTWARSVAGITGQLVANDPELREVLQRGPGFTGEVSKLLDQIKPTLPVLLANLTSVGQVAVKYNSALEQILVLLPPIVSSTQSYSQIGNSTGLPLGEFALTIGDPPACTVGFLPPSAWRSPADTTTIDTPEDVYCKLPQDSPINVRGIRNSPCVGVPGKRAPTVEMCESDQSFTPLAQREHVLGPAPLDPSLIAQGVPPDRRVDPGAALYAPTEGTPLPPAAAPAGTPPDAPRPPANDEVIAPPLPALVPPGSSPTPTTTPSSFEPERGNRAPVAVATYNPSTGMYVTADHRTFVQSDLAGDAPRDWTQLLPR